jgi:hemerythrin-like domain-containing protein
VATKELVHAVKTLQQDHAWIEENWIALSPLLSAVAEGSNVDEAEFRHYVEVFLELSNGHIAMEENADLSRIQSALGTCRDCTCCQAQKLGRRRPAKD